MSQYDKPSGRVSFVKEFNIIVVVQGCFTNSGPTSRIVPEMERVNIVFVNVNVNIVVQRNFDGRDSTSGHQSFDDSHCPVGDEKLSGESSSVIKFSENFK